MKKKKQINKTAFADKSLEEIEQEINKVDAKLKKRKRSVEVRNIAMLTTYVAGCLVLVAGVITGIASACKLVAKNDSMMPIYDKIASSQEYKDYINNNAQQLTDQLINGEIDIATYKEKVKQLDDKTYLQKIAPQICDQQTIDAIEDHHKNTDNCKALMIGGLVAMLSGVASNTAINVADKFISERENKNKEQNTRYKETLQNIYNKKKDKEELEKLNNSLEDSPYNYI